MSLANNNVVYNSHSTFYERSFLISRQVSVVSICLSNELIKQTNQVIQYIFMSLWIKNVVDVMFFDNVVRFWNFRLSLCNGNIGMSLDLYHLAVRNLSLLL